MSVPFPAEEARKILNSRDPFDWVFEFVNKKIQEAVRNGYDKVLIHDSDLLCFIYQDEIKEIIEEYKMAGYFVIKAYKQIEIHILPEPDNEPSRSKATSHQGSGTSGNAAVGASRERRRRTSFIGNS